MPDRVVRAAILDSRAFNELTDEAEVLYRRLLSVVDDFGGYEADPELIQIKCFWRKRETWSQERIGRVLSDLCIPMNSGGDPLARVFTVDGKRYLKIYNLGKPRALKPRYPQPPEDSRQQESAGANTCKQTPTDAGACRQALTPEKSVRYSTTTTTTNKDSKNKEETEKSDEFVRLYPAHRLDDYGAQCFLSKNAAEQDAILGKLRIAVKSPDWTREGGRYVPKASKWIMDGSPAPSTQPSPAPAPWKADW